MDKIIAQLAREFDEKLMREYIHPLNPAGYKAPYLTIGDHNRKSYIIQEVHSLLNYW